jgi:prepilin-type N-terminal cleavage/methylation domain-containing protein
MFLNFFKKNLKNKQGFSLVELIVVMAIFLMITAVVIADIPNFREKSALDLTVSEVATYIRGAQVYGAAQKGGGGVTAYIIKFNNHNDVFALYKKNANGSESLEESYQINGFAISSLKLSGSHNSECLIPSNFSIKFNSNNYASQIGTQLEPEVFVEGGNINCGAFSYAEIGIASIRNNSNLPPQCVRIYNNGQIAPAGCDD